MWWVMNHGAHLWNTLQSTLTTHSFRYNDTPLTEQFTRRHGTWLTVRSGFFSQTKKIFSLLAWHRGTHIALNCFPLLPSSTPIPLIHISCSVAVHISSRLLIYAIPTYRESHWGIMSSMLCKPPFALISPCDIMQSHEGILSCIIFL